LVLFAGDADEVLTILSDAARKAGIPVVMQSAADVDDRVLAGDERASIALIAVRALEGRSAIVQGLRMVEEIAPLLTPDAIRIVVTVRGVARVAPRQLLRPLSTEILHQVESAVKDSASERPWRNFRLRFGLAALTASGIGVHRVAYTGA
jgi:hypothetical protein